MARVSLFIVLLVSITSDSAHSEAREARNARVGMHQLVQEIHSSEAKWDDPAFDGVIRDEPKHSTKNRDESELQTITRFMDQDETSFSPSKKPLIFSPSAEGQAFTLLAVGDVLLHQALASQGMRDGFSSLWSPISRSIASAEVAYANLEGPAAGNISKSGAVVTDPGKKFDGVAYTGYPRFNYHPSIVDDLKASGFDIASTANNHGMDRLSIGVDRTIEAFRRAGLPFTGTTAAGDVSKPEHAAFTNSGGLRIAWIACTFSTNGISDRLNQVFLCFGQREKLLAEIRKQKGDPGVDLVVVTPHWGEEYTITPGSDQKKLARQMIEAGALLVLGSHPHVLQPLEKITASDGREGLVIYSLGNFVSNQRFKLLTKTAAVLFVGLTKKSGGEVVVNGVRHLPTVMEGVPKLFVRPAYGNSGESRALANRILQGSTELLPTELPSLAMVK